MPNISPPPTYVSNLSDPIWKKWFSEFYEVVTGIESGGGGGGGDVPTGGTTDQHLAKASDTNFDTVWVDPPTDLVPDGGVAGQVLTKNSGADQDIDWVTPAESSDGLPTGGVVGQYVRKNSGADFDASWEDLPNDLPTGGTSNQVLTKDTATDFDASWQDAPRELPAGGSTGQSLTKTSNTDYDVQWTTVSGGGGGGSDTFAVAPISSGTVDISTASTTVWVVSLTEDVTTITLPTQSGTDVLPITIFFTQDTTGFREITFPSGILWSGLSPPSVSVFPGKTTQVDLWIQGDGVVRGRGSDIGFYPIYEQALSPYHTISNEGYNCTSVTGAWRSARANAGVSSGKYYWEVTVLLRAGTGLAVGVSADDNATTIAGFLGSTANAWAMHGFNGDALNNSVASSYGTSFTTGDVISIALDMDDGKVWFGKNGTWPTTDPTTGTGFAYDTLTGTVHPAISSEQSGTAFSSNHGQGSFSYPVPTGFLPGILL